MSTVKNHYNPLSIEQQVRHRIEKKASGVTPREIANLHSTPKPGKANSIMNRQNDNQTDLSTQFMSLLFSDKKTEAFSHEKSPNTNIDESFNPFDRKQGTKNIFFPLKEQEESKQSNIAEEKAPFSLVIESANLGELKLNGQWLDGRLKVIIHLPKSLDLNQKKVLTAILERKLSHELNVQTEIEID